jgi:hypothetical protein
MHKSFIKSDQLIFTPDDVDLTYSPLRKGISDDTYVLGAFNPGLCRLPNGNLLMMVRVAEALSNAFDNQNAHCIRWNPEQGFMTDAWPLVKVISTDPRSLKSAPIIFRCMH